MSDLIRPALTLLLSMTLVTGVAYPLAVTGIAQAAFPAQAGGSLIHDADGKARGSTLLAQAFDGDAWFHPRPSAGAYATVSSSASNLAPGNPALAMRIRDGSAKTAVAGQGPVPLDLLTTSGSGLDPHVSPEGARYQVARVAQARGIAVETLRSLVEAHTERPLIGPPVINVLGLNRALEGVTSAE